MKLGLDLQQCLGDTAGFWDGDMDLKEQEQAAFAARNPFREVLYYTSELLTIIRLFQQQALGDHSSSPSASVYRTAHLVAMLDILSAHTQTISICVLTPDAARPTARRLFGVTGKPTNKDYDAGHDAPVEDAREGTIPTGGAVRIETNEKSGRLDWTRHENTACN
ncbi:hypothetical protein CIB48_g2885 [Xylaria polymorpha]|nr:hypothetical protein CIB48_g2885 [Xylaria polymorpha]